MLWFHILKNKIWKTFQEKPKLFLNIFFKNINKHNILNKNSFIFCRIGWFFLFNLFIARHRQTYT